MNTTVVGVKNPIQYIHHISDVQIRLLKRHAEYQSVFARLYDVLRETADRSIIVLAGDINHSKTELSPELVDLTAQFIDTCASISPTILIPGNHDCNLNNRSRMDSLEPLVKILGNENLYYIKDSGIVHVVPKTKDAKSIWVSVFSIFETKEQYDAIKKIGLRQRDDGVTVGLFHGTVNSATNDFGYKFTDGDLDIAFFDGYDMVLLGDIHRMQRLQEKKSKKPEVWYAGSLIQQNHGEDLNKGFLTWDINTCKPTFVRILNDYGYYTIRIKDDIPSDYSDIPKKCRLRILTENTDHSTVKRILTDIRKKSDVQDFTINRDDKQVGLIYNGTKATIGDIRDVNHQNHLLTEFLTTRHMLDDELLERIRNINSALNARLVSEDTHTNVSWDLQRFDFGNMFSYGENNYIDFTNMQGAVGIFAANATGKSAVLDALSFCLFDKSSRAFKASEIVNTRKDEFTCRSSFKIGDTTYYIERRASKRKYTDQTKVDVDFWYEDEFGDKHSLNGEERRGTDDIIRTYIGSYEDFTLTALSVQGSSGGFIEKGQSDRKDLLSRFLGLNVLEELYQAASTEISEVDALLKDYQRQDFSAQLATAEEELQTHKKSFSELNTERKRLIEKRDICSANMVKLAKEIIAIGETLDIDELTETEKKLIGEIEVLDVKFTQLQSQEDETRTERNGVEDELSTMDEELISSQYDEICRLEHEHAEASNIVDKLRVDIGHKLNKLNTLKKHEYDPNCKYCMNNAFVKDAIRTKEELVADKSLLSSVVDRVESALERLTQLEPYRDMNTRLHELFDEREEIDRELLQLSAKKSKVSSDLKVKHISLKTTREKIKRYYENEDTLKKNAQVESELEGLQTTHTEYVNEIESLSKKLQTIHAKVKVAESTVKSIHDTMEHAKELEEQFSAYQYYLEAMKRDGIAYELISRIIPQIEMEVNNILNQIVDFSLVWQLDGKNINVFIVYDENKTWPLDLTSGMERFISNIAIRTALLNVSSLPRPNFLAIDEGFGVLDAENINSVYLLMEYLKTKFDFILIITHLDSLKDVVDSVIEVKKDSEDFSVVQFE